MVISGTSNQREVKKTCSGFKIWGASGGNAIELSPRGLWSLQEQASLHPMKPQRDAQMPLVGGIFSPLPGRSSCTSLVTPHRGPEAAVHRLDTANCVMCCVLGRAAKPSRGACAPHPSTACRPAADSPARHECARRIRNGSLVRHMASGRDTWGPGVRELLLLFPFGGRDLGRAGRMWGKLHQYCGRLGYGSGCQMMSPSLATAAGTARAWQSCVWRENFSSEGMLT